MADIRTIKKKLIDEVGGRDIHGMSISELEEYARAVNAIASIPEKSYSDYLTELLGSGNGFCASGGVTNG